MLCKSRRAGSRILSSLTSFVEDSLYLKVNRDKSGVVSYRQIKFLGYTFYKKKGEFRFRIHPSSVTKLKAKVKQLTSRSNGIGNERRKAMLSLYIKGWVNYFKYADILSLMKRIDEWYRRRLRMVIWKQWKLVRTRFDNLKKLGINKYKAWEFANTRKLYWRISKRQRKKKSLSLCILHSMLHTTLVSLPRSSWICIR
ncbi:MAG: group II intron maturase-specific domain-containing protein [Bacteroidales bacterium]